jgi:hypothetical protein
MGRRRLLGGGDHHNRWIRIVLHGSTTGRPVLHGSTTGKPTMAAIEVGEGTPGWRRHVELELPPGWMGGAAVVREGDT